MTDTKSIDIGDLACGCLGSMYAVAEIAEKRLRRGESPQSVADYLKERREYFERVWRRETDPDW